MEIEMRVYPKPLEIGDLEGFTPEKDLFNRAELGRSMSHLVATVEDPLVIAFDGPWGSGKTTFLKMWAGELRKAGHPVIFFDAFENDYVEDAFAALAREIVDLAESKTPPGAAIADGIKDKAARLGVALLKGSLKVGAKIAVRAATAGLGDTDDIKMATDDIAKEADDAAKHYIDELLDSPRKQREIVKEFREALENIPTLLSPPEADAPQKPLIFIIDELDRCKPHFALALLERIKHFMAVPNVHFVLGANMKQLQSSVRFAYGTDVDAIAYLQKFINITIFNIVINEDDRRTDLHLHANHLTKSLGIPDISNGPLRPSIDTIIRVAKTESVTYRVLERAFTILSLAIGLTPPNRLQLGAVMGGLVMMKLLRQDLFLRAKKGTLSFDDAKKFLDFPIAPDGRPQDWETRWWAYLLAPELLEDPEKFAGSISFTYNLGSGRDTLMYMANDVIDRISPN